MTIMMLVDCRKLTFNVFLQGVPVSKYLSEPILDIGDIVRFWGNFVAL